jgi:hypothetical protein
MNALPDEEAVNKKEKYRPLHQMDVQQSDRERERREWGGAIKSIYKSTLPHSGQKI